MIAFLSASIEMAVRSFANALLAIFPFLPTSLATNPDQIMIIIGFAGQGLFAMRFIVQWLTSEGQGRSVIPIAFWYFSIGGGAVLLLYAIWRQDPVIICGQGLGLFIYLRNLFLIRKSQSNAAKDNKA